MLATTLVVAASPGVAVAAPPVVEGIAGTNRAAVPPLDWGACAASSAEEEEFLREYRCTTVEVPLSYREPEGQSVELALGMLPASDPARKLGTLFWNPGGPGGSGRIPPAFSDALHARFDIVGFDPRGVGASTQLQCFTSNEQAFELLFWDFPITLAQERRAIELTRRATDLCARNGGPILEHMSTANVARDLDLLRQAVGDDQLTYLGFSYGTHVGAVYANLFPDRVRAMTLDSVLDPNEWTTGYDPADAFAPVSYRIGSHLGADRALSSFLAACAGDERCAFREAGVDLRRKYDRLLARLRRRPIEIVDPDGAVSTVTYQAVVGLTLGLLYDAGASGFLADALESLYVASERPAALPARAGAQVRRALLQSRNQPHWALSQDEEPYFGIESTWAVLCTDSSNPANPWAWPRYARRADREAHPFGSPWVYLSLPCATWPASDADRYTGPWNRPTSHPLLLVGNQLGDPATPYEDTQRTADHVLADARLLTLNSFGHVAFDKSACVVRAVERYVIDLRLPAPGTVCQPDLAPFDPAPQATAGVSLKRLGPSSR
ncbi:MAG: alpha/beta hydrolase [Solirubrobacteraceae bacterium]